LTLWLTFAVFVGTGWRSEAWAIDRIGGGFGFRQLPTLQLTPLHSFVMWMGLFVVLATWATEEKQNRLSVLTHAWLLSSRWGRRSVATANSVASAMLNIHAHIVDIAQLVIRANPIGRDRYSAQAIRNLEFAHDSYGVGIQVSHVQSFLSFLVVNDQAVAVWVFHSEHIVWIQVEFAISNLRDDSVVEHIRIYRNAMVHAHYPQQLMVGKAQHFQMVRLSICTLIAKQHGNAIPRYPFEAGIIFRKRLVPRNEPSVRFSFGRGNVEDTDDAYQNCQPAEHYTDSRNYEQQCASDGNGSDDPSEGVRHGPDEIKIDRQEKDTEKQFQGSNSPRLVHYILASFLLGMLLGMALTIATFSC
jgi:hypothetical protein